MAVVCMVNRKGGVGKTTITLALADFLSGLHGRNVLIIDVDPQANASLSLLGEETWYNTAELAMKTVADLFTEAIDNQQVQREQAERFIIHNIPRVHGGLGSISLIPSSPRLQEAEERALEEDTRWRFYVGSPYLVLQQALINGLGDFDYVLIDCPPSIGLVTLNALSMSNGYLMPTVPDHVSTVGLSQIVGRVTAHSSALRRPIERYGTIITRAQLSTNLHLAIIAELRAKEEVKPIWDTIVPMTITAPAAVDQNGSSITLKSRYGGGTHALYQAYENLSAEFIRRIA